MLFILFYTGNAIFSQPDISCSDIAIHKPFSNRAHFRRAVSWSIRVYSRETKAGIQCLYLTSYICSKTHHIETANIRNLLDTKFCVYKRSQPVDVHCFLFPDTHLTSLS